MMVKKSFVNSIFYPLAILSGSFFIIFAVISLYVVNSGVKDSIESQLKATSKVFASSIRKNIASGVESEVFRKCNSFAENKDLKSLMVISQDGRKICNIDKSEGEPTFTASRSIYFDEDRTQLAATVKISFADTFRRAFLFNSIAFLAAACILLTVIFFGVSRFYVRKTIQPVSDLASSLTDGSINELKKISKKLDESAVDEIRELYRGVEEQAKKVELYHDEIVDSARWKTKSEFSSIVAHDIKSPLSSIEMIIGDEGSDPVIRRMLKKTVKRVYEMIDEIISNEQYGQSGQGIEAQIAPVDKLVRDQISVSKYAIELSSQIEIDFKVDKRHHFDVLLSPKRFQRAISNLIKNSKEALPDNRGEIKITVFDTESSVNVKIRDNGIGIEKEKVELLGVKGNTIGKEGGTGLGLYQVKEMVKAAGGDLFISSDKGKGMTTTMILPKYDAPTRVSEIEIELDHEIVILDDEEIIKEIWIQKFLNDGIENLVHYFSNSKDFKSWRDSLPNRKKEKVIGLFDKDLKEKVTGLELLIESEFGKSYLVTGDSKNIEVLAFCRSHSIGLISKNQINAVPIKVANAGPALSLA